MRYTGVPSPTGCPWPTSQGLCLGNHQTRDAAAVLPHLPAAGGPFLLTTHLFILSTCLLTAPYSTVTVEPSRVPSSASRTMWLTADAIWSFSREVSARAKAVYILRDAGTLSSHRPLALPPDKGDRVPQKRQWRLSWTSRPSL